MANNIQLLSSSLELREHPMIKKKNNLKRRYFTVLEYLVKSSSDNKFTYARLEQYRTEVLGDRIPCENEEQLKCIILSMMSTWHNPWMWRFKYWLLCDAALILLDKEDINTAAAELKKYMSASQQAKIDDFI